MNRLDAYLLLRKMVRDRVAVRLSLAAEAAMEGISGRFGGDSSSWGLCGLLHALDHGLTRHNLSKLGFLAAEIARDEGAPAEVVQTLARFRGVDPQETRPAPARVLSILIPALERMLEHAENEREWANLDPASLSAGFPALARDEAFLWAHGLSPEGFVEILQASVARFQADVFTGSRSPAHSPEDSIDPEG